MLRLIVVIALLLHVERVLGADPFEFSSVEYIGTGQGLPSSTVFSVAQDKTGFIWAGTPTGMGVFDGASVRHYQNLTSNTAAFPLLNPGNLYIDSQNRIWAGSWGQGIAVIQPQREHFIHYPPGSTAGKLASGRVQSFFESRDGTIWVGTVDDGLVRFDEQSQRFSQLDDLSEVGISDKRVWGIAEDAKGNLWVGTTNGLNLWDRNTQQYQQFLVADHVPVRNRQIRSVLMHNEQLWLGTRGGLTLFEPDTGAATHYLPPNLDNLIVNKVVPAPDGGLWLATAMGLFYFDIQRRQFHSIGGNHYSRFPEEDIRDLHLSDNLLWLATRESGVIKLNLQPSPFSHYKVSANDNRLNTIWDFEYDPSGNIWLGTSLGVLKFNLRSKSFQAVPEKLKALLNERVFTIATSAQDSAWGGGLWIGTASKLYHYQPELDQLREFSTQLNATGINEITEMLIDSQQRLWVGVSQLGLYRLDPDGQLTHYQKKVGEPSLSGNQITRIIETPDGSIWVGTMGNGLSVMAAGEDDFKPFRYRLEQPSQYLDNAIQDFTLLSNGEIWVATATGLLQLDPATAVAKKWTTEEGLVSNEIKAIIEDPQGKIWVTTALGLSKITPETGYVQNLMEEQGPIKNQFNVRALMIVDGDIYLGGDNGINRFDPEVSVAPTQVAPVLFRQIWINNVKQDLVLGQAHLNLRLEHTERHFRFELTSLDFRSSKAQRLKYQLAGFDDDWRQFTTDQNITYTNLDPGRYRLLVAASLDGMNSQTVASVSLEIAPPLWRRWSVILAALLVASMIVWGLYRLRIRRLHRNQALLEKSIAERTQELADKNAELTKAYQKLEQISLTDQLTGLKNRRFLSRFIEDEIHLVLRKHHGDRNRVRDTGYDADLVFYLIDLDHFKSVNDTHGHDAGDRVLTAIPDILSAVFRQSDYFVRWGGEEFLVVARHTNRDHASVQAERLRLAFAEHYFELANGDTLNRTASIGYAAYPFCPEQPDAFSWQDVVTFADHALYAAKHSGRNNWVGMAVGEQQQQCSALDVLTLVEQPKHYLTQGYLSVTQGQGVELVWNTGGGL